MGVVAWTTPDQVLFFHPRWYPITRAYRYPFTCADPKLHEQSTPNPTQGQPVLALRPRGAAEALGISERKLWEITADQTSGIPHVKLGKAVLYPVASLEQWLAERAMKGLEK